MEPATLDLNINRLRAIVYEEMAQVCRPFYKRLEQLDAVEAVLKAEQTSIARQQGWHTRKYKKRRARIVREETTEQRLLPSGNNTGIYAGMTQSGAILDALSATPGLDAAALGLRLKDGGWPFHHPDKAVSSMYPALRQMAKKGLVRSVTNQDTGRLDYYLASSPSVAKHVKGQAPFTDVVAAVVRDGPANGMNRSEVLEAVLKSGYKFDPGASSLPSRHITWTLKTLRVKGRVMQSGSGSGAIFSKPKVTAVKH